MIPRDTNQHRDRLLRLGQNRGALLFAAFRHDTDINIRTFSNTTHRVARIIVCGIQTSSHTIQRGAYKIIFALCTAHSPDSNTPSVRGILWWHRNKHSNCSKHKLKGIGWRFLATQPTPWQTTIRLGQNRGSGALLFAAFCRPTDNKNQTSSHTTERLADKIIFAKVLSLFCKKHSNRAETVRTNGKHKYKPAQCANSKHSKQTLNSSMDCRDMLSRNNLSPAEFPAYIRKDSQIHFATYNHTANIWAVLNIF